MDLPYHPQQPRRCVALPQQSLHWPRWVCTAPSLTPTIFYFFVQDHTAHAVTTIVIKSNQITDLHLIARNFFCSVCQPQKRDCMVGPPTVHHSLYQYTLFAKAFHFSKSAYFLQCSALHLTVYASHNNLLFFFMKQFLQSQILPPLRNAGVYDVRNVDALGCCKGMLQDWVQLWDYQNPPDEGARHPDELFYVQHTADFDYVGYCRAVLRAVLQEVRCQHRSRLHVLHLREPPPWHRLCHAVLPDRLPHLQRPHLPLPSNPPLLLLSEQSSELGGEGAPQKGVVY